MYQIKTQRKTDYCEELRYVRKQENGVVVLCQADRAQGIVSPDGSTSYAFKGSGIENLYEVAEVDRITVQQYTEDYIANIISLMPDEVQAAMIENETNNLLTGSEAQI